MKVRVGLTGGIGSGKSFVAQVIEKMGYPVYYSDTASKQLVDSDPEIREELITLLGSEAYTDNGLNRSLLAARIFQSDALRERVNAIIHPRVRKHFDEWAAQATSEIVFNEAAILFETGAYRNFTAMILVTAPEAMRIERVMKRDGSTEDEVRQRMSKQWSDEQKMELAQHVIHNDGRPLLIQIENIMDQLEEINQSTSAKPVS